MTRFYYYIAILTISLLTSCMRDDYTDTPNASPKGISVYLKPSIRETPAVRTSNSDAEIDPLSVYVLVFNGQDNESVLLDWCKAEQQTDGSYKIDLKEQSGECYAYIMANAADVIEPKTSSWTADATLKSIRESLTTASLQQTEGVITAQPQKHPLCLGYALPSGVNSTTTIGTKTAPLELPRATAKISVVYAGEGAHFTLQGANLGAAPVKAYLFPDVAGTPDAETISTAHYGVEGDITRMMADMNPENTSETLPLYAYESLQTNATFVIIKGEFNGVEGYYRINLLSDDKTESLPLLRNFYYRVMITKVFKPGYTTPQEAIDNPSNNGIEAEVKVDDSGSQEIISNGVDYIGVSNSELIIYDSYAINEFNFSGDNNSEGNYDSLSGHEATILNYKSRTEGEVSCVECTTESNGTQPTGIRFRNTSYSIWGPAPPYPANLEWTTVVDKLTLPATTTGAITKKIIINIPHDFKSGKIKIKIGTLEKEIRIQRNDIISFMGEVLDMGIGFSSAKIDFETGFRSASFNGFEIPKPAVISPEEFVYFSTSPTDNFKKMLTLDPSEHLYIKINTERIEEKIYKKEPYIICGATDLYLTRAVDQSRVKVHIIREPFIDLVTDAHALGSQGSNYCSAFWRNDQSGERIFKAYSNNPYVYWHARVVYGKDFIRLNHLDSRTPAEIQDGDAEDFQINDDSWKTYLQQPFSKDYRLPPQQFRIALTSKNNTGKPRYGLIAITFPAARGSGGNGQAFLIFVRQGEQAEPIFSPSELYKGSPRTYAQAFSPYNLTVTDPQNNLGGPNFSDHKSMNGRGVFVQYPTQQGYIYQWGSDIAIHPTNPKVDVAIQGYTYDYSAPYKEICPEGYTIALTDEYNIAAQHSFLSENITRDQNGLCADGYYDRQIRSNTGNNFSVGTGPDEGDEGKVYYNPKTLASIFIPNSATRHNGVEPNLNNHRGIERWGRVLAPSDPEKQGLVGSDTPKDRKGAYPIRCVKIGELHSGGAVAPPAGGEYEPWQ